MEHSKITFLESFFILVKWRKFIITTVLLFSIVAVIVSLILPKWYTATCTLLPPEEQSFGGLDISSLVGNIPFDVSGLPGMGGPADVYVAILRSRNVRDAVIKENNLMQVYDKKTMYETLKKLDKHTFLDKTEENIIVIKTTAKTRKRAVELAHSYIKHLDRVNRNTRITKARYTREFIEKRLEQADMELKKAAADLRDFQKANKVISIEEQTKAAIEAVAKLEAEVALTEVSYNVMKQEMDASHPKLKQLSLQLAEMQKQVQKIETGANLGKDRYIVPFNKIPDLALQYAFLLRDVEVQKAIYKLLVQQLEQAKIQEAKDTPTIQILDEPQEPELKSKPKRAIIVIATAIFGMFVSLLVVFIMEFISRLKKTDPQSHYELLNALHTLRSDIPFLKKKN